jgi:hypothetical protein
MIYFPIQRHTTIAVDTIPLNRSGTNEISKEMNRETQEKRGRGKEFNRAVSVSWTNTTNAQRIS